MARIPALVALALGCAALSACDRPSRSGGGDQAAASSSAVAAISPSGELPNCKPVACTPSGGVANAGSDGAASAASQAEMDASATAAESNSAATTTRRASAGAGGYRAVRRAAHHRSHERARVTRTSYRSGGYVRSGHYANCPPGHHRHHGGRAVERQGGSWTAGREAHYGYLDEPLDRSAYDDRYASRSSRSYAYRGERAYGQATGKAWRGGGEGYARGYSERKVWTPQTGLYEERREWGPDGHRFVDRRGLPPAGARLEGHSAYAGAYHHQGASGLAGRRYVEKHVYRASRPCPAGAWLARDGRCVYGRTANHEVNVPGSFFYDGGGVGPAFVGSGGGGGGGFVVVGGGASAGARASASAYASARAHVSIRGGKGGHGGHGGGCCKK